MQERGRVERDEMYQVFNMGIGMVGDRRAERRPRRSPGNCAQESSAESSAGTALSS